MDALKHATEVCGSQAELARRLGIATQVVNNWARRGNIPAEYCPSIEKATGGQVVCESLRPDVDWAFLRNCDCKDKVDA